MCQVRIRKKNHVFIIWYCFSYEPEIHPGATVRLNNKAVLKVFTTGSVTLTGNFEDKNWVFS
jgi:TATA-box binding protein (TBP) (component of TFIID and TFIIIB)